MYFIILSYIFTHIVQNSQPFVVENAIFSLVFDEFCTSLPDTRRKVAICGRSLTDK